MGESTPVVPITLTLPLPRAREVAEVLPWVLQALQDRPELSAKQRKRRQLTASALSGLLEELTNSLHAHAPANSQVPGL